MVMKRYTDKYVGQQLTFDIGQYLPGLTSNYLEDWILPTSLLKVEKPAI